MSLYTLYTNVQNLFYNTAPDFLLQSTLPTEPTKIQLEGTFGNDTLTAASNLPYQITGDLSIIANYTDDNTPYEGRNGLVFATGNDTIAGKSGEDTLTGDFYSFYFTVGGNPVQGNNALFAGSDTITGGNGGDLIFGDIAREGSWVKANPDFSGGIEEHYGNDTLSGENGNDVIFGDEGVRSSVGAFQHHYLYFGDDTVDGGTGNDVLVGDNGAIILRTMDGSGDALHLLFQGGDDHISGGTGNDALIGDFTYISVGRISGTAEVKDNTFQMGNDTLNGGNGNDVLIGDYYQLDNPFHWSNTIIGGNDILTGGKGNDTFAFDFAHNGNDIVTDFTIGQDKLVIRGGSDLPHFTDYVSLVAQGNDTLIDLNHEGSILLKNVDINQLHSVQYMVDNNMLVFDPNNALNLF